MMADNEKVIKGLECCFKYETHTASGLVCEECPYNKDDHLGTCTASVLKDACVLIMDLEREIKDLKTQLQLDKLSHMVDELLKEHEPIKPGMKSGEGEVEMSRYGEDGSTGYAKEDLFDEINEFLERHTVAELLKIVTDIIETRDK